MIELALVISRDDFEKGIKALIEEAEPIMSQLAYISFDTSRKSPSTRFDYLKIEGEKWIKWYLLCTKFISRSFNGTENIYVKEFEDIDLVPHGGILIWDENHVFEDSNTINSSMKSRIRYLKKILTHLPLIPLEMPKTNRAEQNTQMTNTAFLIHGHDTLIKLEVARFVENELKKKIIILHEQPNKGSTIIEKFERNAANVDFAIALWTSDDFGSAKSEDKKQARARQNVVFETGYFSGSLGRGKVIVLKDNDVEIFSDFSGVIFISLNENWKYDLRKEIDEIYNS